MPDREPVVLSGRYELHSRIARGGMAEVYLARDQLLDRPVAIKVLFPEFAVDPSFVERFRREAQSAANLSHPAIVGVYDWGAYEGTYFIVMEYVRGRSLAEILRSEGTLHPDRAADIAIDIAGALYFAHRNGVVHRDIKPGNVLISPHGEVKVTDFGIARAVTATTKENLTQTGSVMGTATYFSPEQAQGQPVDPRSDLYSLGVVLYEMTVGRPPFSGEGAVAIAYKHVQEMPVPPRQINPAIPAELEAVCLKLLAKNAANRYASAEDLRADLRRFREGQPVRAEAVMDPAAVAATAVVPGFAAAALGGGVTDPTRGMTAATRATPYGNLRAPDGTAMMPVIEHREPPYEPPRRSGVFVAVLVVLLAVLGGLLYALFQVLSGDNGVTTEPTTVEVPPVEGLAAEDAESQLRELGFDVLVEREANVDVPVDRVISQDPRAGVSLPRGRTVELRVSAAQTQTAMPNVIGSTRAEAERLLRGQGFENITVQEGGSDEPRDQVLDQNPVRGTLVAKDAAVTILVSAGPQDISLPSVSGQSCDQARQMLAGAGVAAERVSCVDTASATVPDGQAIGTDPQGTVTTDQSVRILVSSGPAQVTVPEVSGFTQASAESQIFAAGLQPRVVFEQNGDRIDRVIRQDPEGGEEVDAGTTVTIVIGTAPSTTTSTSTTRPTSTTNTTNTTNNDN